MGTSWNRPMQTRLPLIHIAVRPLAMPPWNAWATTRTCGATLWTQMARERTADSLFEGTTDAVTLLETPRGGAAEMVTGLIAVTTEGATNHERKTAHVMPEGLLEALRDTFVLHQATHAAACAKPFKGRSRGRPTPPRPLQLTNIVIRLVAMTPRNAGAAEKGCEINVPTQWTRMRATNIIIEGVTGSITFLKAQEVSVAESYTGSTAVTGFGATNHASKAVHVTPEGLLKDFQARCDIFVFRQATSAAASANPFVTDAIRPEAGKTLGMLRDVRNLRGMDMGANYLLLPLGAFVGTSNKASANGSNGAQLSANRLKIWRSACMIAVGNSLHSCAEGRAYGPSLRLLLQR
jgi:hypothetical protein